MKARILSKSLITESEYDYYPNHLGTFSNEKGEFAIKHSNDPYHLSFFNANNVDNMKQARANYQEAMKWEAGNRIAYHTFARATIEFDFENGSTTSRHIDTCGIWGMEGAEEELMDPNNDDYGNLKELDEMLSALKNLSL